MSVYLYAGKADSLDLAKVRHCTAPPALDPGSRARSRRARLTFALPKPALFPIGCSAAARELLHTASRPLTAARVSTKQCDVVAACLRGLPSVRVRRFVRVTNEWEEALRSLCTQWQIQGWGNNNECMVWTGAGQLVGAADDFVALVEDKYSMSFNPDADALAQLAEATSAAAAAEIEGRGKFVVLSSTRDGSMCKVLMVKPNSSTPFERFVRESNWKTDMDKLLGKAGAFSDGVEIFSTSTVRVFAWVNGDAEFGERENALATLALGGAQLLAQQCFRYTFFGTVLFYTLAVDCDTPVDYSSAEFDAHFETPEMLAWQQEMAAVKIQAMHRGAKSRAAMHEETEMKEAATKIQSRFRGVAKRKEMAEEASAATAIQSRFRGHKMREVRREEEQAAVKIQALQRGNLARRG